ncbi:MnhA multicomponent sodium ion:proton antiporter [Mycobacterium tuberculosis]|nr:MnhA multicomponent sodium ion:proton antiporter [Mycobacterium tuberculosis]
MTAHSCTALATGVPAPDTLAGPLADALIVAALALAALMATAVVLTRDTVRQAIALSGYGMVLGLLFLILQAPDVAMSQIGVGTVLLPLIVVLALHATRRHRDGGRAGSAGGGDEGERRPGAGEARR